MAHRPVTPGNMRDWTELAEKLRDLADVSGYQRANAADMVAPHCQQVLAAFRNQIRQAPVTYSSAIHVRAHDDQTHSRQAHPLSEIGDSGTASAVSA